LATKLSEREIFNPARKSAFERIYNLEVIAGDEQSITQMQSEGMLRILTLPETLGRSLGTANSFMDNYECIFRRENGITNIPILTSSYEIVGVDQNGSIGEPNSGAIIVLHGVMPEETEYDSEANLYLLNKSNFDNILNKRSIMNGKVKIYTLDEILREVLKKNNSKVRSESIILVPENDYFTNPAKYCYDLKLFVDINSVKKNTALLWRTLRSPKSLVKYIDSVDGFEQSPPLIESYMTLDLSDDDSQGRGRHRHKRKFTNTFTCNTRNTLLKKYENYIVPLKLQYGSIVKSVPDEDEIVCALIPNRQTV
jgi:hypothetical protein